MVSDEIVKFRVERSILWIADSFVKIGTAKTRSALFRIAVTEQIGIDLLSLENGEEPPKSTEELPTYTTKHAEESELQSLRLSKTTCRTIDSLIENRYAQNRSEYLRRAAEQFFRRERERILTAKTAAVTAINEADIRRICREETREYHRAAETYFA